MNTKKAIISDDKSRHHQLQLATQTHFDNFYKGG
jgi:hypothetical protein